MNVTIIKSGEYRLNSEYKYYSQRYKKWIILPAGMLSDGATCFLVPDLFSMSWWIHDRICEHPFFTDNTPITAWKASQILSDILRDEGRIVRSVLWKYATFFLGCKKARENGWF